MNPLITAFEKGIEKSGFEPARVTVTSDIIFEPEVASGLGIDYFHVNRGRAIAFGAGMKLSNPNLRVVSFIGDSMTLGGNHFVHNGRRNMEQLVICVNSFAYRKVAGQKAPVPSEYFSPFATFEEPFNAPHLANSCGAIFTARWTALHTEELAECIGEALQNKGFSVIEVLCPGPNFYSTISQSDSNLLEFYHANSVVKNDVNPRNAGITAEDKIVVGTFTRQERPTYIEQYNEQLGKVLGDKFTAYGGDYV